MTVALNAGSALLRDSLRASWRLTSRAVTLPARVAHAATDVPLAAVRGAISAGAAAGVDRQVWAVGGRAMLEVRGLDRAGPDRARAASAVQEEIAAFDGVLSARIDPGTERIAVRFDTARWTVSGLVGALAVAENRSLADPGSPPGVRVTAPPGTGPAPADPPGFADPTAQVHAIAVAADLIALAAATVARLARVRGLPGGTAAAVALAEHQPWLHDRLEEQLGPERTALTVALAGAVVHGMALGVPALMLDLAQRGQSLRAERARRAALTSRRVDLLGPHRPTPPDVPAPDERPAPVPPGPVERLASRSATGSLVAAGGLLAGTADADLAGRAVLVGVPRAAHCARQAFADEAVVGLASREVVTVDPKAVRLLDRVTTVVLESHLLHDDRPLVVEAAAAADGWTRERVWRVAQRLVDARRGGPPSTTRVALEPLADGPAAGREGPHHDRRFVLVVDGRRVGEVTLGRELHPLADAVLSAVREADLRLVLTEDGGGPELHGRADEVLRAGHGTPGRLRRQVRRLQAEGQVVAVVGTDAAALDAADLGIGLVTDGVPVPWTADVVCGPGLDQVPRLLGLAPAARETSERGVRVATGATFLGGLLLAVGSRRRAGGGQWPVTLAAAGAMTAAILSAQRALRRPDPVPVWHTPWHALEPEEVVGRLPVPGSAGVDSGGPEAEGDGPPVPTTTRALRATGRLAANVRAELADPLTPVLATGAAASAVIGSPTDALLVGGVLAGSGVISGAQRMRAERAMRDLMRGQRLRARVVTGDEPAHVVPAPALRPGHVVDLEAGDVVPADARLLLVQELEVDEATLTGESAAVGKQVAATPGAELPDRACMVYEGTTVVAGTGRAVVVAVGAATEAGRALALAGRAGTPAGMQSRLEELTSRGLPVTLVGGAAVTALALLRGRSVRAAIGSGVSVSVAAVPEGLPLMATVTQLGAARRLSARGVLVRSSRTIEALGRVDTVCFDKTGTLTQGRLRLVRAAGLDGDWEPEEPRARRVLRAAALAGPQENGRPLAHATDQAVLDSARAVLGDELDHAWEELAEVPFHSDRGFSAVLGRTPNKDRLVLKGAPEVLLPRCSHVRDDAGKRPLDQPGRERAAAAVHALADRGLRVLAVARRNVGDVPEEARNPEDVAALGDLTLLGFIGLADAPRPTAAGTVADLRRAGLRPVMITGDHPVTARAIAEGLGIDTGGLVTGPELAALEESARVARVGQASVFARVSPEQKLQIVSALRDGGRAVAMVGDGANDAAAIRLADVGIGMAAKGSTAARSAADLVLTEPDVSLVLDALVEGRAMWRRVRNAVAVLLGGNAGEVLFTLLGTALGGRAPIGTRQFLVVNMFTDLLPSMALALAPTPTDERERAALLAAGPPSLGRPLLRDIGVRGTVTSVGALAAWLIGRAAGSEKRASTVALATLVGAELGQTLLLGGRNPLVLTLSLGSAAAMAAMIQTPGVSQFFGCTPLGPVSWATVLSCSVAATVASVSAPRLLPGLLRASDPTREVLSA